MHCQWSCRVGLQILLVGTFSGFTCLSLAGWQVESLQVLWPPACWSAVAAVADDIAAKRNAQTLLLLMLLVWTALASIMDATRLICLLQKC